MVHVFILSWDEERQVWEKASRSVFGRLAYTTPLSLYIYTERERL